MPSEKRLTANEVIALLDLKPLYAEGGVFRRTWESSETMRAETMRAETKTESARPVGTAIYALFSNEPDSFSALHRLDADEVWHHYLGDPLQVVLLPADGSHEVVILGDDLRAGQVPQLAIGRGTWMGACVRDGDEYALIGCTMAPGFVSAGFEGGMRADLLAGYPKAADWIERLTRNEYGGEQPQEQ
jgi:uncharacterized protein